MHVSYSFCLISSCSIRAKLRDAAPGYDITSSFFLCCLYKGEDGDLENPLDGFLKGPLLVRVSFQVYNDIKQMLTLLLQAFRHIFTSPSSATKGKVTSRQRDVANILRMNNHVTSRSIAYTATQVRFQFLMIFRSFLMSLPPPPQLIFSLSTAREWKREHNGFYYPLFYDFIVDFFEDIEDDRAQKNVDELLDWWNRYVALGIYGMTNILIKVLL